MTLAVTRLKVLARRARLDRELAAGVDPRTDEALALRAAQLERPAARTELALAIERILDAADEPHTFSASAPLNRPAIRATRPALLALAHTLRGPEAVRAQGVALTRQLVIDGAGPLYAPVPAGELDRGARAVLDALPAPGPPLRMTA